MSPALKEGSIFSLGNPLLDISADVDDDFLQKWGLKKNSAILAEPGIHDDLFDDMIKRYASGVKYIAGGAVQNAVIGAQWFLRQPNICVFMGCIGDDEYGRILAGKAKEAGVKTMYMISETERTGTCAVCISEGGKARSLVAYLGAANAFKKDHLIKHWKAVEEASIFYISGFHLTVSPDSILEVAKYSSGLDNKIFTMNLSAAFISDVFGDRLLAILPYIDILFGNEDEAAALARALKLKEGLSVKEMAEEFARQPKKNNKDRLIVITQGADEVITVKRLKESTNGLTTRTFPVQKLPPEFIVDTNGAGDAFVGGFLSQLVQGKDLDICVKAGIYGAHEVIQLSGATYPPVCNFKS